MSALSPDLPTVETDYKSFSRMPVGREVWDFVLGSVGARLRALEAKRTELQETIDTLQAQALQIVSETISAEITAQRAALALVQEQLEVVQVAYAEIQAGGVFADTLRLRAPISAFPTAVGSNANVQKALEEIGEKFNAQRRINSASIFLGAS
jgi:hypothetical protein